MGKAIVKSIIILLNLLFSYAHAQDIPFDKLFHIIGSGHSHINSVCEDEFGNTYIAGQFTNTVYVGDTSLVAYNGNWNIYIAKFNSEEKLVWIKKFGEYVSCLHPKIILNNNNEIVLHARIHSTINTIEGDVEISGPGVIKFDSNGNALWAKGGIPSNITLISSLTIDSDDNIIYTGYFSGQISIDGQTISSSSNFNIFFIKLTSSGELIFLKGYGYSGYYEHGSAVCTDKNNDIYLGINFSGSSIAIEDTVINGLSNEYNDIAICKFNSLGELIKFYNFEGNRDDRIDGIFVNDSLDIIFSGRYGENITIGDSTFNSGWQYKDMFCAKMKNAGELIWARSFNDDDHNYYNRLVVDSKDYIYLSVQFYKYSSVGDTTINHNGGLGFYIVKLNPNGQIVWVTSPICVDYYDNEEISLAQNDNLYVCGHFSGDITIGDSTLYSDTLYSHSEAEGFLYRIPAYSCNSGKDISICKGDSTALGGNPSAYNGALPYSYDWIPNTNLSSDTVSNPITFINATTEYILKVTDAYGQITFDTITVIVDTIPPKAFSLGEDFKFCQNDTVTLIPEPLPEGSYLWNTGDIEKTLSVWEEGKYYLKVFNACGSQTDTIVSSVNPIYFTNIYTSFCKGDSIFIIDEYHKESGKYYDSLTTIFGCDSTIVYNVVTDSINTNIILTDNTLRSEVSLGTFQWLDCNQGFSVVEGAINEQFTPNISGVFSLEITYKSCIDTTNCYELIMDNIECINFSKTVNLYPNPTNSQIFIDFTNKQREINLTIFNLAGKPLYKNSYTEIASINHNIKLPTGIYLIEIINEKNEIANLKLLVK